ncbi:MAG TPA: aspartate aminotransferase family protein [Planctomycetota bacterium]|nr:aspartate aminotransferase family protein [Planctomycetota bacterium]HRR80539.1 aspartate aminotransferase family protein [Planctomycetota bacterium]HRT94388.1 aspartate aminotransferase family protein [Planctomycetota bacterium]
MGAKELYDRYLITSMVAGFEPIEVVRAAGCTVTGADGREYLDCFSGIAVVNAGHGHPKVLAAAREQMEKLVHCCTYVYYNPRAAELAKRLAEVTPGALQKSFFGNSGAEAIEGAVRLAKQFTRRHELVALTASFHGRTVGTLSISGNRGRKKGFGPYLSGVAFAPAPYCYRCPLKLSYPACGVACAEAMADVLRYQTAGDVAAFVAEPVMGEGGIIVPPPEYFQRAVEIVRKDGALFIADEVQCGFGRTGKLFAIEHYGVEPDILCLAKGIADGFPLSAFIARPGVADAFAPGDHLSTFGGNPVSCAAGLANLDVMLGERLPERAAERSDQLMRRLAALRGKCPLVGDVRGKGLMVGIELVRDAAKTPADAEAREVRRVCREAGVLVGLGGVFGNVLRLQPPLVVSPQEVDRAADVLASALGAG